jgi:hypothetical protein
MTIHAPIADRLLNAFPSASYGLPALLQLSEIVESTEVPTAAVECLRRPRMLINPQFVAEHANTPDKLVTLVMHELHHVILGHTRLFPRVTPLDNIVFDAVINSMLCWLMPERAHRALFEDFYDHAHFPACFLRPPPGWLPTAYGTTPDALTDPSRAHLAALHRRLYSQSGATYEELRQALSREVPPDQVVALLGDHSPSGEGSSSDGGIEHRAPELIEHIRRIVERWPQPPNPIAGRSASDLLKAAKVTVPPTRRTMLAGLLRKVAGRVGSSTLRAPQRRDIDVESPLPRLDRRTSVLRGLGMRPMLFRHPMQHARIGRGGELVHIYLDVSGSMSDVIGALYRAVLDCEGMVHRTVHVFSTEVVDIGFGDLRRGSCPSTGGTCIECVANHMRRHQVRRAVIVTDGFVGTPGAASRDTLASCRLGVALTGSSTHRRDLEGLANHWIDLNGASNDR